MNRRATLYRLKADFGELLAVHERGRDLNEFTRWEGDPVGFCTEVLRAELTDYQEDIAGSVRARPLVVVQSCNAAGKDFIAAHLALWFVYARRGLVLITGPTQRQVREIVMGEVGRAWGRARDLPGELFQSALRLGQSEQAGILAFTSSEASRLTGFHAPRLMVLLTEAQGVEGFAWEAALACATGAEDRILAVGNPLSPSGSFYAASRSDAWHRHQIGAFETPNVQQGREVFPGMMTLQGVARIESEFGKGSGVYQARVLGEFPDQGEEGLFRRSWLEAAVERWAEWRGLHADEMPVVGIDPARFGPDQTVCALRRGRVLVSLHSWGSADLMETVDRIRDVLEEAGVRLPGEWQEYWDYSWVTAGYPPTIRKRREPTYGRVICDEIGVGAGVVDRLRELGFHVIAFNAGSSPSDGGRFANARAEAYWRLREKLEAGELALPPDEKLFDELVATKWRPTPEGKVRIEPKDDLKARLGRSPDRADALVMAVAGEIARKRRRRGGVATA